MDKLLKGSLVLTFAGALTVFSATHDATDLFMNQTVQKITQSPVFLNLSKGFIAHDSQGLILSGVHNPTLYLPNLTNFLK